MTRSAPTCARSVMSASAGRRSTPARPRREVLQREHGDRAWRARDRRTGRAPKRYVFRKKRRGEADGDAAAASHRALRPIPEAGSARAPRRADARSPVEAKTPPGFLARQLDDGDELRRDVCGTCRRARLASDGRASRRRPVEADGPSPSRRGPIRTRTGRIGSRQAGPLGLLRRHVRHRPQDHSTASGLLDRSGLGADLGVRCRELGEAEVQDLHVPVARQHDVRGLQVAMHDAGAMGLGQPLGHLQGDVRLAPTGSGPSPIRSRTCVPRRVPSR